MAICTDKSVAGLLTSGMYSDITLSVGTTQYKVHRAILAERSGYFKAMFNGGMLEAKQDVVVLKEMDQDAFNFVLVCIYRGSIYPTPAEKPKKFDALRILNVVLLLDTGFDIGRLSHYWVLGVDNVLPIIRALKACGGVRGSKDLLSKCREFLCVNHASVVQRKNVVLEGDDKDELLGVLSTASRYTISKRILEPDVESEDSDSDVEGKFRVTKAEKGNKIPRTFFK
jgi:hypothetical protein